MDYLRAKKGRRRRLTAEGMTLLLTSLDELRRKRHPSEKLGAPLIARLMDVDLRTARNILEGHGAQVGVFIDAFRQLGLEWSPGYLLVEAPDRETEALASGEVLPDSEVFAEDAGAFGAPDAELSAKNRLGILGSPKKRPRVGYLAVALLLVAIVIAVRPRWPIHMWAPPPSRAGPIGDNLAALTLDELKTKIQETDDAGPGSPGKAERDKLKCGLVVELSKRAWDAMWTKDEPVIATAVFGVQKDILSAFEWALKNDPSDAMRIIGNAHRVFLHVPGLDNSWKLMARRALDSVRSAAPATEAAGRANIAVAAAYVFDLQNWKGVAYAQRAVDIFTNLRDHETDLGNAYRHLGMCVTSPTFAETRRRREKFYLLAKEKCPDPRIDPRWLAQVYLSIGESYTVTEENAAENLTYTLKALSLFEQADNAIMIKEAIDTSRRLIAFSPVGREPLYASERQVLEERSKQDRAGQDWESWIADRVACLHIDFLLGRRRDIRTDLETCFSNHTLTSRRNRL